MKVRVVLLAAALVTGGCSMKANTFNFTELAEKTFTLQSVDGVAPDAESRKPIIHFAADGKISGAMCNRFMGQGKFNGNVLTVDNLASTRMLCSDNKLNQWDGLTGETLKKGVQISLDNDILTLQGAEHTLIYKAE